MYSDEADDVYLTREHIINQMVSQVGNLIDAISLSEDQFLFTKFVKEKKLDPITKKETDEFLNEDIFLIKSMWLKYMRKVYDILGTYRFEYVHPYKGERQKNVTELEVYYKGEWKYGYICSSEIDAECQGYIKEFCNGRILSPSKLADTVNELLKKELESFNYINDEDAKFTVDNLNMLGATSKKGYPHNICYFLFSDLMEPGVVRGSKIDKILD